MDAKITKALLFAEIKKLKSFGIEQDDLKKGTLINYFSQTLLREIRYKNFIKDQLGVFVAGYFFVNPLEKNVKGLFENKNYAFPYYWSDNISAELKIKYEKIINAIFSAWRTLESLDKDEATKPFMPEYILHLPLSRKQISQLYNNREKELREHYGAHYCTLGELAFYIYSWRFFIRFIQIKGNTLDINYFDKFNFNNDSEDISIWANNFINKNDFPREYEINTIMENLTEELTDEWNRLKQISFDEVLPQEFWIRELINQNLIKSTTINGNEFHSLASLEALVKFLNDINDENRFEQKDIYNKNELLNMDLKLKRFCLEFWASRTGADDIINRANNLHKYARAPFIPYYYWNLIDKNPKAHLVFPSWDSQRNPQNYIVFTGDIWNKLFQYDQVETFINGFLVLAISPLQYYDWTCNNIKDESNRKLGRTRLYTILNFYDQICKIVADDYFYKLLEEERAKTELKALTIIDQGLAKDFTHRLRNILVAFESLDRRLKEDIKLRDLYDKPMLKTWTHNFNLLRYYVKFYEKLKSEENQFIEIELKYFIKKFIEKIDGLFPIKYVTNLKEIVQPIYIYGPEQLLSWIFDELTSNSLRHTKKDELLIEILLEDSKTSVEVHFRDDGEGFSLNKFNEVNPKQKLTSVTELFDRGISSKTTSHAGFGLWRVKNVIENNFRGKVRINETYKNGFELIMRFKKHGT